MKWSEMLSGCTPLFMLDVILVNNKSMMVDVVSVTLVGLLISCLRPMSSIMEINSDAVLLVASRLKSPSKNVSTLVLHLDLTEFVYLAANVIKMHTGLWCTLFFKIAYLYGIS